ncbi:hypothetical protein ICM05_11405 [Leucobacter sp. cx-42]|uniref:hypothetical protein n=1 Tax=unclassified Leucobacter TaxID=2621730 RepID=UPI00165D73A1|nr:MULTISPECIES: hypothetical protein [unclassified Leucobacter]MBC9955230.1 hypothetical protein [Leucobacter sp. cx-42]
MAEQSKNLVPLDDAISSDAGQVMLNQFWGYVISFLGLPLLAAIAVWIRYESVSLASRFVMSFAGLIIIFSVVAIVSTFPIQFASSLEVFYSSSPLLALPMALGLIAAFSRLEAAEKVFSFAIISLLLGANYYLIVVLFNRQTDPILWIVMTTLLTLLILLTSSLVVSLLTWVFSIVQAKFAPSPSAADLGDYQI